MHTIYFLIGSLGLLIALLFFGIVALTWGLRQLLIIRNQNDTMISLLEKIFVSTWNEAQIPARLQEDYGDTALPLERISNRTARSRVERTCIEPGEHRAKAWKVA
jgi:hypothetical protein